MSCREHNERVTLGSGTLVLAWSLCMPPTEMPSSPKDIHETALRVRAFWPGNEGATFSNCSHSGIRSVRGTRTDLRNLIFVLESGCFSNVGNIVFEFPPFFKVLRISREGCLN